MNVLVIASTEEEIIPIRKKLEKSTPKGIKIELVVTGVGSVMTTYAMMKKLSKQPFDLALNIGLAGTFKDEIKVGDVVVVINDQFADLGAEDDEIFISVFELGLMYKDRFPFTHGRLKCDDVDNFPALAKIRRVKAITVNTVHGNENSIQQARNKFRPDIESMEGAAFHYICLLEKIPCIQLRAISNRVEKRNRSVWNITSAIENVSNVALDFLTQLKDNS